MTRSKTSSVQSLKLTLHANDWRICPIHSLGCLLLLHLPSDELVPNLFTMFVDKDGEVAVINTLLRKLATKVAGNLTEGLTSHSFRHGGATMLAEVDGIELQDVIQRGNWSMSSVNKVFTYIGWLAKGDMRSARSLAGWISPFSGGEVPQIEDDGIFELYCDVMFSGLPGVKLQVINDDR